MNLLEYYIGDDPYTSLLQLIIIILSALILRYVYSDNKKIDELKDHIKTLDKECPECPDCKCESDLSKCPDCVCPDRTADITENNGPNFPMNSGLTCPEVTCPSVKDIVDGLFPGRNMGITASGKYHDINSYEEGTLLSAYSNFSNLVDSGEDMRMKGSPDLPDDTENDTTSRMNMGNINTGSSSNSPNIASQTEDVISSSPGVMGDSNSNSQASATGGESMGEVSGSPVSS
jgi:hypothetical protein